MGLCTVLVALLVIGGKRSRSVLCTWDVDACADLDGPGVEGPGEEAACATRSHTWRVLCFEVRAAVECLALSTRPEEIPA